jgi:hypothetical protein
MLAQDEELQYCWNQWASMIPGSQPPRIMDTMIIPKVVINKIIIEELKPTHGSSNSSGRC